MQKEVTMPAIAAIKPPSVRQRSPLGSPKPTCAVCAASMVAAEASALGADNVVSYLWTCDVCGYGFVTDHNMQRASRI